MADYTEAADRTATLQQICHWGRRKEQRTEKKNKSRTKINWLLHFLGFAGDLASHRRCRREEEKNLIF